MPPPPPGSLPVGTAATQPWSAAPPSTRSRRQAIVSITVALAVLGGLMFVVTNRGSDHPDAWDPAVVDLVAFVEQTRALEFDHPVHIVFTDDEAIDEALVQDLDRDDGLTEWAELQASAYRSSGLADGELDVAKALRARATGAVEAFYRISDATIVVPIDEAVAPDAELPVGLRVTLVHELVHALQHQHFDSIRPNAFGEISEIAIGIIEGDASLVERLYLETLDDADFEAYLSTFDEGTEAYEQLVADVPSIMLAEFADSYILGESLATVVHGSGGFDRLNRVYDQLPTTTRPLLDPYAYLASPGDAARGSNLTALSPDGELFASGSSGPVHWYLAFSEFMSAPDALDAARNWEDDWFESSIDDDDRICTAWSVQSLDRSTESPLATALANWARRAPNDRVADQDDELTIVTACDPGTDLDLDIPVDLSSYLVFAQYVIAGELWATNVDLPADLGRCVAAGDLGANAPTLDSLSALPGFRDRAATDADSCR